MSNAKSPSEIKLGLLTLMPGSGNILLSIEHAHLDAPLTVGAPQVEIDHLQVELVKYDGIIETRELPYGGREMVLRYQMKDAPGVMLDIILRSFEHSPILRMKYRLTARKYFHLTKLEGYDHLTYFRLQLRDLHKSTLAEYQLSHFDQVAHSYRPNREDRSREDIPPGLRFVGPVALFHTPGRTLLAAYEHGSDHPNSFFDFMVEERGGERALVLKARKGNYYDGRVVDYDHPWESVWFELGLHPNGLNTFLPIYRRFFLEEVCENRESRQPYIYYNTWNYQERKRYFDKRPYIESMTAKRMLEEIDVAHQLGVDVFVIDTGWYIKTGDWLVNKQKFPEGMREIRRRLDQYGMKLGLWFNPTVAALTSKVFEEHPEWEMTWNGKPRGRHIIWETPESTGMCLASDYADYYVDTMVRLHDELGVSYFKWDAVQQYGCDSSLHNHGIEENNPEERAESYAYQMGLSMIRIVEAVTRRCPGVIVDFDVTEGGRFVGLGFLSVGKYFLINNGPYFHDFDIPRSVQIEPDTINVFFYPGPARPRICRQSVNYDQLIPSILLLTHYLPDAPNLSQRNSIASLVLGGNGFWGDLPALSKEDVDYLGGQIELYKRVADGVTRAYPIKRGFIGSSPEIYEKISPEQASGLVSIFTVTPGTVTHYTQPLNLENLGEVVGADACEVVDGGRLKLSVNLNERDDARVVYVIPKGK